MRQKNEEKKSDSKQDKKGGGVLIAVVNYLTSKLITANDFVQEAVFVSIRLTFNTLIIGCSYITKPAIIDTYINNIKIIEDIFIAHPEAHFIFLGDYNLRNISWSRAAPSSFTNLSYTDPLVTTAAEYLNSMSALLNLHQLYPIHPGKGYTLDLRFSESSYTMVNDLNCLELVPCGSHHISIVFEYKDSVNSSTNSHDTFLFYKRIDSEKFTHFLINSDFSFIDNKVPLNNYDDIFVKFYNIIKRGISLTVPVKHHRDNEFPSWYDHDLIPLIYSKKEIH